MQDKREGVMLAYPADEGRISRLGSSYIIQPKFKGERCRVEWFHNEPVLISSYGNEFKFLTHITEGLKKLPLSFQLPFDGEIYKHGWNQGRINSAANRKVNENEDSKQLEFHIFDLQLSMKQVLRLGVLVGIKQHQTFSWPLVVVESIVPTSKDQWKELTLHYVEQGYEGIIFRKLDGIYTPKRNTSLLKFKPTETDEYKICEVLEAIDKNGERKNTLGAFLVRSKDETVSFKVGAGKLNHLEREQLWERRETLIGKILEVKHEMTRTEKGIPDCAVAVRVL